MRDQLVAESSTWQKHNTHNREISMPPVGFDPQSQEARGHRPMPQTAWPLGPVIRSINIHNLLLRSILPPCINQINNIYIKPIKSVSIFAIYFIHNVLTNMFRPLLRPSSEWYYYKNTKTQMWLAVSTSLGNNNCYNF